MKTYDNFLVVAPNSKKRSLPLEISKITKFSRLKQEIRKKSLHALIF